MGRGQRGPGRRRGIWAVVLMAFGAVLYVGASVGIVFIAGDGYDKRSNPSDAMAPAYERGAEVWFKRVPPQDVRRGDAVLATPAASWRVKGELLKRVVALGGDRISWAKGDTNLTLNGKPLDEPYILDRAVPATAPFDVTVPEGRMFVMGDNRFNSMDSHLMTGDSDGGTLPLSAAWGVTTATPVALLAASAVGVLGVPVFLTGGGLGIGSLVARRRAAKAARNAPAGGTGHVTWSYEAAARD